MFFINCLIDCNCEFQENDYTNNADKKIFEPNLITNNYNFNFNFTFFILASILFMVSFYLKMKIKNKYSLDKVMYRENDYTEVLLDNHA